MCEQGLIKVFGGDGKGKTTTALGFALQCAAVGGRVLMVQFLKPPDSTGEHFAAPHLGADFTIMPVGRKGFITKRTDLDEDRRRAAEALANAKVAASGGEYDLIVLDELNVAVSMNLAAPEEVIALIDAKAPRTGLILTGRNPHPSILERAAARVEMRKVRHHYDNGVTAQQGVEY